MSIDSCYQDVITKLTSQGKIKAISRELLSMKRNDERVLYVFDVLKSLNALPNTHKVTKSESVSTYYRNQGNKCYQASENYKAWQYYNLSLLHAPLGSENYSLALANRSAVFFSLNKYRECLNDIEEVFSLKYPEKLKEKLNRRKALSKKALVNNTCEQINPEVNKIITLQEPKDDRYLCASTKLKVMFNKDMGRHAIANEDIKVGEVLVQEDPYFTLLLKSQYLFSCSYCLSRELNLLPCPNCCFSLYCSEKCKNNAQKEYHMIECPLMATLVDMEFTKLELLALRTVIKARNDHSDWENLFKTIKDAEAHLNTDLHGHVKINDKWIYDSKYYTSIHTLASNIEQRSISDIFQKSVTAAVFLSLLNNSDFLKGNTEEETESILNCVAGTLLLHIMTSPTNMHGISSTIQTPEGNYVDEISLASAPYAFHSVLNHSCAPNVVRVNKLGTGQMTLIALRPIKKGMQIFDNYGPHHALADRQTRHSTLKFQYKFTCLCEACINDWPTYLNLKSAKNLPMDVSKCTDKLLDNNNLDKLQKGDVKVALKIFKGLCDLAEKLEPYAPCVELANCQESLKQCLVIFAGLLPYGYSKLVEWEAIPPKVFEELF